MQYLYSRQKRLKTRISRNLDILIGSVVKSPSMGGHCLTDKVKSVTVTRYLRKSVVDEARRMTRQTQRLWKLLRALSRVNWEILKHKAR